MNPRTPGRAHVLGRIAAALLGSYAFVWSFTAFGIALGLAAGLPYDEAQTLMHLLAFLLLLVCFLGSFAAASLTRVWAVLAGGAALMSGAAWLIARAVVPA